MSASRAVVLAMQPLVRAGPVRRSEPAPHGTVLTRREREVLVEVAAGRSNRDIARRLAISEHTVKSHLRTAMLKLGAHTRTGAIRDAMLRGIL